MAGSKDRERRRARERYERQREQRLQRRQKIRRRTGIGSVVVLVVGLVTGLTLAFATGGSPKASPSPSTKATPSSKASASPAAVAEPAHHCTYTASGTAAKKVSLPPATPDYSGTYTATINTSVGKIEIALANSKATCTVNSFIHLASAGFWNGSQCHRLTTNGGLYVLQCGDPYAKGTAKLTCAQGSGAPGTGGPGYKFNDENLTGAKYTTGTVAMANTGPNSNGSQFFLVYKNSALQPQYTPFGTITSGLDILQKVANAGTSCTYSAPGDGAPKEKVIIDSVTIKKV